MIAIASADHARAEAARINPFLRREPTPMENSLLRRSNELSARGADLLAKLAEAQIRYAGGDRTAADDAQAIQAELNECSRLTAELHEEERRVRAGAARVAVETDPNGLIQAARGRHVARLLELLGAFEGDAWAEAIAARAEGWRGVSPSRGEHWGPEWLTLVDDVEAWVRDRFAGRAA
jgi:hypothetical protein